MALPLLAGPALATAGRYFVQHGVKKGLQKYGPKAFQQIKETQGLKAVGDKVIKKRMTPAQSKEMAKPFNKAMKRAERESKGMTEKQFDKKLAKDYREQLRIDKVKAENMAAAKKPMSNGGRVGLNKGGQPSYKNGEMPSVKPN